MRYFTMIAVLTLSLLSSGVLHSEEIKNQESRGEKMSRKEPARKISARKISVSESAAVSITAPELIAPKVAGAKEVKKEQVKSTASKAAKAKTTKIIKPEVAAEIPAAILAKDVVAEDVVEPVAVNADAALIAIKGEEVPEQIVAPDIVAKEVVEESPTENAVPVAAVAATGSILDMMPPDERLAPLRAAVAEEVPAESMTVNPKDLLEEAKEGNVDWARYVVGLIFVGSLLIVTGLYLSKNGGKSILKITNRSTRVVQVLNLGMKRQLAVVDFEGSRLLIAIGASETTLLQIKDLSPELKNEKQSAPALKKIVENLQTESVFKPAPLPIKPQEPFVNAKRAELTDQIRDKIKSLKKIHMGAEKTTFGSILGKNLADEPQNAVIDYDLSEGFKAPKSKSHFNQAI